MAIIASFSMSLDGYIAGPNVTVANGMGDGGESLHDWMFVGKTGEEAEAFQLDLLASTGAFLMGRTMLDVGIEPWGDNPTFRAPVFVVTHRPSETIQRLGGTSYTFVTDGLKAALELAKRAAGGKDIRVEGGASIVRQYLNDGTIDELHLDIVPILLGGGTSLFVASDARPMEFEATGDVGPDGVTHLIFRPRRG